MAGWREALSDAREVDKVIAVATLPPCVLCQEAGGGGYRFPSAHNAYGQNNLGHTLRDPIGRASGRDVLTGLLSDPAAR